MATKRTSGRQKRGALDGDLAHRLYGPGNAYDGAREVIARSKANGTWFDADAPRKARAVSAKTTERRAARRAKELEGKIAGTGRGQVGPFCVALMLEGKSNAEVLLAVREKFPGARTTPASVSSIRSVARREGKLPKT